MKFQCLNCGRILKETKNNLKCVNCGRSWKIEDKIPQFSENSIYWGEITKNEQIYVNEQLKKNKYWKSVLKEVIEKKSRDQFPEPYSFATDLSRANWQFLLSKKKKNKALDIGAGLGTISEVLSHYYDEVISIEPVKERLFFLKKRFEQDGIKNIRLIQANALELPFPENSFDLIVMNGVLEWVALYGKGNPKKIQEKVLKDILKILKPNGYLYIGIENRFCYRNFLGRYDPHAALIFTTLMPRLLANLVSRIFRGKDYRTYIYSYKGYKKLLKKAGFKNVEIYNVLPDYNVPTYIIPLKNKYAYEYLIKQSMYSTGLIKKLGLFVGKIFAKIGLIKYFLPAYIVFGRK